MTSYEERIMSEIASWERKLLAPPGMLQKASKSFSMQINQWMPKKLQQTITATVKTIVRTALFGVEYTPKRDVLEGASLEQRDKLAAELVSTYQKVAAAEGAGTGSGGLLLAAVDFPALIAIQMRLLFELAHVYGFSTRGFEERIYILQLFQLNYASEQQRSKLYGALKDWPLTRLQWQSEHEYVSSMDWEQFQTDYRDSLDFRKMLQLLPGIGAVVGAWANYGILQEIGETAINGFRLRHLDNPIRLPADQ